MIIKHLYHNLFYFLLCAILTSSCARVSSPQGGERDTIPPTLVESVPYNGQLNFKDQTVYLEFDELVTTNQIENNLIITPKPSGSYRTRNNRNRIQLEFTDAFADSTTYTFSFANSIEDLTEKNNPEDLVISFSTGNYLDSLRISGTIKNLYDQIPEEDVLVSLYAATDSFNILNGPANYYTKTDSTGTFNFQNLPPNLYRVYAVIDKNNNNKADSDGELYGFYTDTIQLDKDISDIDFTIQRLSTKELRLIKGRHFGRYYELSFNKSITDFQPISNDSLLYHQTKNDMVRFYRGKENFNDTTDLIFEAIDSLGYTLIDTAQLYYVESEIDPEPLNFTLQPKERLFPPNQTIEINFNKPTYLVHPDSIEIFVDSLNIYSLPEEEISNNPNYTKYTIPFAIKNYIQRPDQKVIIRFKPSAFISVDADTSILIEKVATIATAEETALIKGMVQTTAPSVIVQLLKASNLEVISETRDKNFEFNYLSPGTYMIRAINDINQNGIWDIGNILKNEAPEPVSFYFEQEYNTQLIEVRKYWERTGINIFLR